MNKPFFFQIMFFVITALTLLACSSAPEADLNTEIQIVKIDNQQIESRIEYPTEGVDLRGFVAFSRGSGGGSMDTYIPGFFDQYLRGVFLEQGIAVVYQNKRGIGKSSGNWKQSSMEGRSEDLLAVVDYYRIYLNLGNPIIGIVGHSEGGWVVQHSIAEDPGIDFAVSLAGPVTTPGEQDLARVRNNLICEGLSGEDLEKEMNKRLRTHEMWRNTGGWFPFFDLGRMHNVVDYSPAESLRDSNVPLLLLYGGNDSLVPSDQNLTKLAEIFPGGIPEHITVSVAQDSDHWLQFADSMCVDYNDADQNEFSMEAFSLYSDWVKPFIGY